MEFEIKNTQVYGINRALVASGNSMRTKISEEAPSDKDEKRVKALSKTPIGSGHDQFLVGIIVQMDVMAPLYWWKQAQRYNWFTFISSQSTMHCLTKFDFKAQITKDVDPIIAERYSKILEDYKNGNKDISWRTLVASLPSGFVLGATMTTNYRELKTMYFQRKNHPLSEWKIFCDWCETLPFFKEWIILNN